MSCTKKYNFLKKFQLKNIIIRQQSGYLLSEEHKHVHMPDMRNCFALFPQLEAFFILKINYCVLSIIQVKRKSAIYT